MIRCVFATLTCCVTALPVAADPAQELFDALRLAEVVTIMREEGLEYGAELGADLAGTDTSQSWGITLDRIYNADQMTAMVAQTFTQTLEGKDVSQALAFFQSDDGKQIIDLELSARRAMTDTDIEEAAKVAALAMEDDAPRRVLLDRFVEANDLIEANVSGSLNSAFQFYAGMVEGGAFDMSDQDILSEVWSQEPDTREDTEGWVYGFLGLAYGPLSDAELEAYIDLSATEAGQSVNQALFTAFNDMYDTISYALGRAIAREMQSEDL